MPDAALYHGSIFFGVPSSCAKVRRFDLAMALRDGCICDQSTQAVARSTPTSGQNRTVARALWNTHDPGLVLVACVECLCAEFCS